MRIGTCVSLKISGVDAEFAQLRANGFDNCQLISWDMKCYDSEQLIQSVKASMQKHQIEVTAVWCGWSGPTVWDFNSGYDTLGLVPVAYRCQRLSDIMKGSDFAKAIGATDIVTHVGYIPENPHDANYNGVLVAFRALAKYAKDNGQYFNFETGQETPVTLLRTIQDIGADNLGVNLDPANLVMYGKGNPCDAVSLIGKYVRGVHAKDGTYPTDGHHLGTEKPIGQGVVDFPLLLKKMHEIGFDGPLTIEREIEGEEQTRDILMAKKYLTAIIDKLV